MGSAFALSLSRAGIDVRLYDARPSTSSPVPGQRRPIALSAASVRILLRLEVWPAIERDAQPILSVHVSERGRFGRVRMRASEHGLDALGQVAEAGAIEIALAEAIRGQPRIEAHHGTPVTSALPATDAVHLYLGTGKQLPPTALMVLADGADAQLKTSLGLHGKRHDYGQQAVVCNVRPRGGHQGVAYERFLDTGPLALLPLRDGQCGVVWTLPGAAPAVAELSDEAFLQALFQAFGSRLGQFTDASSRECFRLARISVSRIVSHRTVCIGNAANQLHPVAGQGLNLGLRDAATLCEAVVDARQRGQDPGQAGVLERYAELRRADHRRVVAFTDLLARGFSLGPGWLGHLRGLALLGLQLSPPARSALASLAMGLVPPLPRAARGVEP